MVKAKDLLDKTADEFDKDPLDKDKSGSQDEDEKVNEAYESLSKKLEDLRKDSKDSEDKEDEDLEDKVKQDDDVSEDKEEDKDKDMEETEEKEEEDSEGPKETFTKSQDDPLDEADNLSEKEVDELNKKETGPEEDTLDDLAEEKTEDENSTSIHRLGDSNKSQYFNETSPLGADNPFSQKYSGLTRPKGTSKLHVFILALIGLAIIGGTVYLLRSQFGAESTPTPAPEVPVATPVPQPTPEAVDRSKFKVRILNGTTQTGLAASVSAKLKDLGYQTDKVGNASNSAFQTTLVRVKSSTVGLLDQLTRDLAPDFNALSSSELKDSDSADGEVILGTK